MCGEPCAAVCKKLRDEHKKDYEPYQTMGPLAGVFDQRAAEGLTRRADTYGFDAISAGGVVSWLMECLSDGLIRPEEIGVRERPIFKAEGFDVVSDSAHNAQIGVEILDAIIERRGILNLSEGARKFARHLSRDKGKAVLDPFLYVGYARKGWMVPNQYWTPGVLSPVSIMVESAGQEVGDLGHIYVDGRNVSPEGRGYNLAVMDPQTGVVEATASFDTHLDEGASRAMADFVVSIPEGRIVAVSVRDEASRLLSEEAVQALRTIGAEDDLREKFRWGQAIIGVKGAQPGQAVENLDALRPAVVYVGEGTTEPHLAAAFSLVRFVTMEER